MTVGRGLRFGLPAVLVGLLAWLMVGCVYVPWFETAQLTGTTRDVRDPVHLASGGPRYDGIVVKDQVLRWLGPPAIRSANDRVWVYTMEANHGIWIEPLCLNVTPGDQHAYALGLRFDDTGVLEHHTLATVPVDSGFRLMNQMSADWYVDMARGAALGIIDRDNGVPPYTYSSHDDNPFRIQKPSASAVWPYPLTPAR